MLKQKVTNKLINHGLNLYSDAIDYVLAEEANVGKEYSKEPSNKILAQTPLHLISESTTHNAFKYDIMIIGTIIFGLIFIAFKLWSTYFGISIFLGITAMALVYLIIDRYFIALFAGTALYSAAYQAHLNSAVLETTSDATNKEYGNKLNFFKDKILEHYGLK